MINRIIIPVHVSVNVSVNEKPGTGTCTCTFTGQKNVTLSQKIFTLRHPACHVEAGSEDGRTLR